MEQIKKLILKSFVYEINRGLFRLIPSVRGVCRIFGNDSLLISSLATTEKRGESGGSFGGACFVDFCLLIRLTQFVASVGRTFSKLLQI